MPRGKVIDGTSVSGDTCIAGRRCKLSWRRRAKVGQLELAYDGGTSAAIHFWKAAMGESVRTRLIDNELGVT